MPTHQRSIVALLLKFIQGLILLFIMKVYFPLDQFCVTFILILYQTNTIIFLVFAYLSYCITHVKTFTSCMELPSLAGDDFAIIQQEIIMMKDCKHANIVQYLGSYLRKDRLWICMEYCGGGSLQDIYHGMC